MDSLKLLHDHRPEPQAPSADALASARAALMNAIEKERPGARTIHASPRKRSTSRSAKAWRWGMLGGVAAVAAGTLVVTQVVIPYGTFGSVDPAVAAVLTQASDNAMRFSDPVLHPGQYLKVTTRERNVASGDYTDPTTGERATRPIDFMQGEDFTMYVPADRASTWVWVRQPTGPLAPAGSTTPQEFAALTADPVGKPGETEYVTGPAGRFYGSMDTPLTENLAGLPQDPQGLLRHIYAATVGHGTNPRREAFVWMVDRLRLGTVDAQTRSLFFRTMALIPGSSVLDRSVTLDGQTGTAVQAPDAAGQGIWQIVFDPSTGQYIGEREVGGEGFAPNEVTESSSVTVSVAQSAPTQKQILTK